VKGVIYIEVPDEFVAGRVEEMLREVEAVPGDPVPTPEDYFRRRLEDVADDELRIAFFGWPLETSVDVHGWFEAARGGPLLERGRRRRG
jgi:hypothetical protein